jgi:transcriptional regulator with XRE-family HTH domain
MTGFNERLKAVRKGMELSQEAFGGLAGVSLSSQSQYERDGTEPGAAYFLKLAEMGIDMNFLLGSKFAESTEGQQTGELQAVLNQMPPTQQAMAFVILSLVQETMASSANVQEDAAQIWRAGRVFRQFLNMSEAGKRVVEVAVKGGMIDLPPKR